MIQTVRKYLQSIPGWTTSSQAGFTLLEMMIAVAIIAISFVSLLGSQSQSISLAAIARFDTSASLLARRKLAELQVAGFDELSSGEGDFSDDFSGFHWQVEVNELAEDESGIAGSGEMLKVVDLRVSRGTEDSYQIRTVIMAEITPEAKQ